MPKDPCSELAKTITQLAMNIGAEPHITTLDQIVAELQKDLPEMNLTRDEVVRSIDEATSGHAAAVSEVQKKLQDFKREARGDIALRRKIIKLEQHLKEGTLPEKQVREDHSAETVRQLREIRDGLKKQLAKSEPAVRERLEKQIETLANRIEDGVEAPAPRLTETRMSRELERMQYERDRLRAEINRQIKGLQPKGFWGRVAEPINLSRAIMTSIDLSAVLRQGGFITIGHPIRAARSIVPMFRAMASKEQSHKINQEILNRENAPLYARSRLYLAPEETASLTKQEEMFMSRLAGKIPLVAGSQRAYNTFLNKLRADSFDAMAATLGRNREVTLEEAAAIANYINVATGRANLGRAETAASTLNTIFFAPRYVYSRFQLLAGQPMYRGTARTRVLVATEYARLLAGMGVIYTLGILAGGSIEEDPRSSDFGKLKLGDTRIDPTMGLSQVSRVIARTVSGKKKQLGGKVVPIRGPKTPFGAGNVAGNIGEFLRTKLAPIPGAALDVVTGENVVHEPVSPAEAVTKLFTPISFNEVYQTMEANGVGKGTALALLGIFGMGLQHHEERKGKKKPPERED